MNFKKILSLSIATLMVTMMFVGCAGSMTEEEAAAQAEKERYAAYAQEEAETGVRRLVSENLSEAETVLKQFVEAIQAKDVASVAQAIAVPNVFTESTLRSWIIANDYDALVDVPPENIRVRSTKEGSVTQLDVWINTELNVEPEKYKVEFTDGKWAIIPPNGIAEKYVFTAPSKNLSCNGVSLTSYAVATDSAGHNWTFEIPRFPILEESPNFVVKTNLGEFDAKLFATQGGNQSQNIVLACLTDEQKKEFEESLTTAINTTFNLLKSGATRTDMTSVILSETVISDCFPNNPDQAAEYRANVALVNSASVLEDDIQVGFPEEYTYRLAGEDGVVLDAKLSIDTALGESRKKATFTIQNFNGVWKIVNVTSKSGKNPFVEFGTYNPAW